MDWPKSLIRQISTRRVIFFLGSGVSATSKTTEGRTPKTWKSFILEAKQLLASNEDRNLVAKYVNENKLLLALELIKKNADETEYKSFLDEEYLTQAYIPSKIHETILKLDSRIVITTNFDKIYERYCAHGNNPGYKVITYYSGDLVTEIRSDNRLILKAHGSIDEVNKMIFTMSGYHEAKRDHPNFYEVLKALFLTNTIVFLGCKMDDPDVLLILEEVKNISKNTVPHYVLSTNGSYNFIEKEMFKKAYGFNVLEYGDSYDALEPALQELFELVQEERSLGTDPV